MGHRRSAAFVLWTLLLSGCATTRMQTGASRLQILTTRLTAEDVGRFVLVTMRPAPPWVIEARTSSIARDFGLQPVYGWPLMSLDIHCVVYMVADDSEPSAVSEALAADSRVESAQPMHIFEVLGDAYNDPYYHLQSNLQTIHLGQVHRWATGKGVRVAVVDTGIDPTHPDLRDRIIRSDVYPEMNLPTADSHGTGVAGVIAATANNEIGVVGIAPDAKVMSLKACSETEAGTPARCNSLALLMAIEVAIMERVQVLNLSLAGPHDPLLARQIAAATMRGVAVIAACDEREETLSFPASLEQVIAVRSVDPEGRSRGLLHSSQEGELAAPGVDILTTVPGGYDFVSGSSFAAAHLSGIVALLREREPALSPEEVATLLRATAYESPTISPTENGNTVRVVNVCAALTKLTGQAIECTEF